MTRICESAKAFLAAAAFLASGCAAHRMARGTGSERAAVTGAGGPGGGVEAAEPTTRNELIKKMAELKTIGFDFDSYVLGAEARGILAANAAWLKEHPTIRVQVSGHCDQRGTVEYNLALGQRRAKAVRDYYRRMGIAGGRVATISYGKEKLLCEEQTETCWQRNRRAETLGVYGRVLSRVGP